MKQTTKSNENTTVFVEPLDKDSGGLMILLGREFRINGKTEINADDLDLVLSSGRVKLCDKE